jgi:anaerobic dimethyl sulfoxide reductase subunit B
MATQLGFYVDMNLCTGCKACQVACKDKWDLKKGVLWRRVAEYSGGNWIVQGETFKQNIFAYYVSVSCNHCEAPICAEVCPTKGIVKRSKDGVVLIDAERCIGCRYCQWACPYGALQYSEEAGHMTKCNFCYDNLDKGLQPACVASCPSRALKFGPMDELQRKYGSINDVEPLPEAHLTKPALVLNPHKDAQLSGTATGETSNPREI